MDWNLSKQSVRQIDDRISDVLKFRVTALTDRDWEFLKNEWDINNGYVDNEQGKEQHNREHNLRICYYDTVYRFDITSFYGEF